jgi:hypothetical protein
MSGYSNTNVSLAKTFSHAISENRADVINAIGSLIPADRLIRELEESPHLFNEDWARHLLRDDYTNDDTRILFTGKLIAVQEYVDFLKVAVNHVKVETTKFSMLLGMISSGLHKEADECLEQLGDITDFKLHVHDMLDLMKGYNGRHTAVMGNPTKFTRHSAHLFNRLDIDIPGDFDGTYSSRMEFTWSKSRFYAAVDYVSDIVSRNGLGIPSAEIKPDGSLHLVNSALLKAHRNEWDRINALKLGKWHEDNFPLYCPVITTKEHLPRLIDLGAVLVKPELSVEIECYNGSLALPKHGFSAAENGRLDEDDVNLSMSLLPYHTCSSLREAKSGQYAVLLPYNVAIDTDQAIIPGELAIAMRSHRPDFIKSKHYAQLHDLNRSGIDTRLYLRGMNIIYAQNNRLSIFEQITEDRDLVAAFNSIEEMKYLRDYYSVSSSVIHYNKNRLNMVLDRTIPIDQAVVKLRSNHEFTISKLGYVPNLEFKGSVTELQAIASQNFRITEDSLVSILESGTRRSAQSVDESRLEAQLGALYMRSSMKGLEPEDVLKKAVRISDENEIATACGILDRLGQLEVAKLAKTPAQIKFVMEHFDLSDVVEKLPKNLQSKVSVKNLEEGLGL